MRKERIVLWDVPDFSEMDRQRITLLRIANRPEWQHIGNQIDAALISRDSAPLPGSNKSLTFCDPSSENPNL